jgi:hypothetical protein
MLIVAAVTEDRPAVLLPLGEGLHAVSTVNVSKRESLVAQVGGRPLVRRFCWHRRCRSGRRGCVPAARCCRARTHRWIDAWQLLLPSTRGASGLSPFALHLCSKARPQQGCVHVVVVRETGAGSGEREREREREKGGGGEVRTPHTSYDRVACVDQFRDAM